MRSSIAEAGRRAAEAQHERRRPTRRVGLALRPLDLLSVGSNGSTVCATSDVLVASCIDAAAHEDHGIDAECALILAERLAEHDDLDRTPPCRRGREHHRPPLRVRIFFAWVMMPAVTQSPSWCSASACSEQSTFARAPHAPA